MKLSSHVELFFFLFHVSMPHLCCIYLHDIVEVIFQILYNVYPAIADDYCIIVLLLLGRA